MFLHTHMYFITHRHNDHLFLENFTCHFDPSGRGIRVCFCEIQQNLSSFAFSILTEALHTVGTAQLHGLTRSFMSLEEPKSAFLYDTNLAQSFGSVLILS